MSYIDFFQFREHPFRITPDVEFYFTSQTHSQTYESLKYFIESDEGFFTITGEPGTGKTITLRKFLNELPEDVEYAYILFPSLEPEDMFRAVLEDFGYKIDQNVSKNTLFSGFRDFLTEKKAQGKRILLIIDEAQNLPMETMEELRILSNLETEKEKLIQFVLAGQPELGAKLNSAKLRQLRQRISLHTELKLLDAEEIERYVVFRLSKAGYSGQYPDPKFYKKLASITNGNPRVINLTMERALMSAYLKQSKFLVMADLDKAAQSLRLDLKEPDEPKKKRSMLVPVLIIVIAVLAAALAFQLYTGHGTPMETPQETVTAPEPAKPEPQAQTEPQVQQEQTPAQEQPAVQEQAEPEPPKEEPAQPEPAPEPQTVKGYVTVDGLNLRSEPTAKKHNIVAKLDQGTAVVIKDSNDAGWIEVETDIAGKTVGGWVYKDFLLIPEQ